MGSGDGAVEMLLRRICWRYRENCLAKAFARVIHDGQRYLAAAEVDAEQHQPWHAFPPSQYGRSNR